MPAGFVTVCLYTAAHVVDESSPSSSSSSSSQSSSSSDDGVHAEVALEGTQWRSTSRALPTPDWEQAVTITLHSTATGDAIATATHPLEHAFAWGAERCRLPLVHPTTHAVAGSLHVGIEYASQQEGSAVRAVAESNSGKEREDSIIAYLDAHITPTLKAALVDVVQEKPEQPLQFVGQRLMDAAK